MNRLYNFRYLPLSGPISGSDVLSQTERAFNELGATSLEALDVANNAVSIAGKAANDAISAITTANEALAMATNASNHAQNAVSTANQALGTAQEALSYANDAIDTAQQALSTSDTALTAANNALAAANRAQSAANAAQETANSALGAANTANIMALANEEALNVSLHFQHPPVDSVLAIGGLYESGRYFIIDPKTPGLPVEEAGFLTIRAEAEPLSASETEPEALIDEEVKDFRLQKTVQHFLTMQGVGYVRIGTATVNEKEETASIVWDEWVLPKPAIHASESAEYGMGDKTLFGHVRLSDSTSSPDDTARGVAATPLAVKKAFDLAQFALDTKQDTLAFDAMPTAGSTNPVTSGGVKAAIEWAISTVYKWKGSVDAVADLPLKDNELGDVYNVRSSGANYGWTGTEWDNLGGIEAVDAAPVKDSGFPVASGGVFDAIKGVSAALDEAVRLSPDAKNELIRKDNGLYATTPVSSGADNLIKYKDDGLCAELPEYLKGMFTLVHAVTVSSEFNKPDAICSRVRLPELIEEYGDALRILVLDGNDRGVWAVNDPSDWTPVDIDTAYVYCLNRFDRAIYSSFDGIGWKAMMAHFLFSDLLDKPVTLKGYGISDAPTKTELETGLAGKQNTLSFDSTPTAGSSNPVTSDGVKAYVDAAFGDLDAFLEDILS